MLSRTQDNFLDRFITASARLVVLQNLKACYEEEKRAQHRNQVNKNFRTAALLEQIRFILEFLDPYMVYFADTEQYPGDLSSDQIRNMMKLMTELSTYYEWACEEVKLKMARQSLIRTSMEWDDTIG